MKHLLRLVAAGLAAAFLTSPLPVAAQSGPPVRYIVVLDDASTAAASPSSRVPAHAGASAWDYLDPSVLQTVQALELEFGFQAEHVYSATIRGFSARLLPETADALARLPFVHSVEFDTVVSPLGPLDSADRDELDRYLDGVRALRGSRPAEAHAYVVSTGAERVPGASHVSVAAGATCFDAAARVDSRGGERTAPGIAMGVPVTVVSVTECGYSVAWSSAVLKAVDWVTARATPSTVSMSLGGSTTPALDRAVTRSAEKGFEYVLAGAMQMSDPCAVSPQGAGTHDRVIVAATLPAGDAATRSDQPCVDLWFQHPATSTATTAGIADVVAQAALAPAASAVAAGVQAVSTPGAGTFNVKVVTDASPDLSDLASFVNSTTSLWGTDREKVWALFYWSHILKRQTSPMVLHGFDVTDPIRNFVDYGFTMCSTISGINQSLYEALGLRHQFWDICNHTVSAVEYDGGFHMVDSSMSNLVTTDDGVTLASVAEAAADSARLVREHSLYSTSPDGFLTGSDASRNLADFVAPDGSVLGGFANDFCASNLRWRDYYYNWNSGHRYVLNLREHETYTRYYGRLGSSADYWVGSEAVSAPDPSYTFEIDSANRFGLRGNGQWLFSPALTPDDYAHNVYSASNITAIAGGGLEPEFTERTGEVIYKVQAGNAITSQAITATFSRTDANATVSISLSINQGATWATIGSLGTTVGGVVPLAINLRDEVNGSYETLIRIHMWTPTASPHGITLTGLDINTLTQVNAKALPALHIGRNEVFVGVGDQSDTMVLWPDLRGDRWMQDVYASSNIASQPVPMPRTYTAVVYPAVLSSDAYLTYRMQSPTDITRLVYGGRMYNREAGSSIEFLHSFDEGASWTQSFVLTDVSLPYDDIHYSTVTTVPPGTRSVLFRFLIHNRSTTASRASGLYAVRMEVNHQPLTDAPRALDVTLRWKEIGADRTTVARSHKERVSAFPYKYVVNVGGVDHPLMESMTVSVEGADAAPLGYSDGIDAGGTKYVHRKRTDGINLAKGKPYTFSRDPSGFQSSAPATNTNILTDGVVGAPATGGTSYWWGQCWTANQPLELRVDLGQVRTVGAVRAHLFGYPGQDAFKGLVQDVVEIQTSLDDVNYTPQGTLPTSLWRKDVPINYMVQDDEKATAWNFERLLPSAVEARFVRYRVTPTRILCASELQVFDRIDYQPFDVRLAPPYSFGDTATVPAVTGLTRAAAETAIANAGLTVGDVSSASSSTVPAGTVISQSPVAGTSVVHGSPVALVISSGPPEDADPRDEVVVHVAGQAQSIAGWVVVADTSAAGGARLQDPNLGAPKQTIALASPTVAFDITFDAVAGRPYRIWLRGKAEGNYYGNDSVFAQFDGSVNAAGTPMWRIGTTSATPISIEDCSGCGLQGWGWADNGYGVDGPVVYFAQTGPQRMRIQSREDGIGIDQVVLSAARYLRSAPGAAKNDATILPATGSNPPPPPPPDADPRDEIVVHVAGQAQSIAGWIVVEDTSAAGGARLQDPNLGAPKRTIALASPTVAFDITFDAVAGRPYRIWLRGKAEGNYYGNDSVFAQFDGSVNAAGTPMWRIGTTAATSIVVEDCSGCGLQGWGWADNGYGIDGPVVYFAQTGPQRMRIQSREDGIGIDQVVLSAARYLRSAPGATKNDATILPATGSNPPPPDADPRDEVVVHVAGQAQSISGWMVVADTSAAGGARLQDPNLGVPKRTIALASPTVAFDITFDAVAGRPYRIWLRGKAEGNYYGNDSVFAQFDGSVDGAGAAMWRIGTTSATAVVIEDCSGCGLQGWGWADNGYGVDGPVVYFAQTGPQRMRIQSREDGIGIDQVVLSAARYLRSAPGATKNDTTIVPLPPPR